MVARTRTSSGELVLIFSRDGEPDERRLAPNGDRAVAVALMMIAGKGVLYAGDRLLVQQDEGEGNADG